MAVIFSDEHRNLFSIFLTYSPVSSELHRLPVTSRIKCAVCLQCDNTYPIIVCNQPPFSLPVLLFRINKFCFVNHHQCMLCSYLHQSTSKMGHTFIKLLVSNIFCPAVTCADRNINSIIK